MTPRTSLWNDQGRLWWLILSIFGERLEAVIAGLVASG
jgi:hypothetical protein